MKSKPVLPSDLEPGSISLNTSEPLSVAILATKARIANFIISSARTVLLSGTNIISSGLRKKSFSFPE